MNIFKLEKDITLYKNQFEQFTLKLYQQHIMERLSMDLDGMLFRIKYMVKHNKDLDKLPKLKEEFIQKALELRKVFGEIMYNILIDIVGLEDFPRDDIEDILALDVKMDSINVKFKMVLISKNEKYLEYINEKIPEGEVFNLHPDDFFRFYTDSYNDGVAKAYPELFENRHQDMIGTGADHDVFVHNFTFQTSEGCNLNCLIAGTMILMEDLSYKKIEEIEVGDKIIAFSEEGFDGIESFTTATVTRLFQNETNRILNINTYFGENLYITEEHPVLVDILWFIKPEDWKARWVESKNLTTGDYLSYVHVFHTCTLHGHHNIDPDIKDFTYSQTPIKSITPIDGKRTVYNLETTEHTYVANNILVHNCTYCYQFNKSKMKMDFATAKEFIDNLLADEYGYINRYNSPAIIIEFIGGEPLLEINLTRRIYEYFLQQTYELNHPWFTLHRLSICSNGLLYFDEEVQAFFNDYSQNISFNISIDGNKELHDSCRIQPNGEGSYDIDMIALNHYNKHHTPERNSKMTLAPENIEYLYESVVNFIENGMMTINLNCIFEEGWNQETALLEYNQLKKLADYILENDLDHLYIAIFNERQEDMQEKSYDGNFCGGLGSMLSLRPNGQFYPCIRYMPTSVGDEVQDLCIGDIQNGMIGRDQNSPVLDMMDNITRRSQSNDICYDCPISSDCPWCSALSHTVYGTPGKRPMFICIQMIAEALANVYYWNLLNIKKPNYNLGVRKNNVPREWSLLVINEEELEFLEMIELRSMITTIETEIKNK